MENMTRRYKATIQDKDYTIVGTKSDSHMDVVVDTINEQIDQIKSMSEKITTEEAAILVAINAVSNQVEMQEKILLREEYVEDDSDKVEDIK